MTELQFDALKRRLQKAVSLQMPVEESVLKPGTPAAVLMLFGRTESNIFLLFLKRTETVETHKGQIAFPGGSCDPEDFQSPLKECATALRETNEETGLAYDDIEIIGKLPPVWSASGFIVTPVVGILRRMIGEVEIKPSAAEVADTFWAPLNVLMHSTSYKTEYYLAGENRVLTHVYRIGENRIWGLTAFLLRSLLERLAKVKEDL